METDHWVPELQELIQENAVYGLHYTEHVSNSVKKQKLFHDKETPRLLPNMTITCT